MTDYPTRGKTPWDDDLKAWIDGQDSKVALAAKYNPRLSLSGLASADVPTFTAGIAADGSYTEGYQVAGTVLPNPWPVDCFGDMSASGNQWTAKDSQGNSTVATYRFMSDGTNINFFTYSAGYWADLFIDGKPFGSNPLVLAGSPVFTPYGYNTIVFGSAKPRLIELRMAPGFVGVYTKKPYRIWKPTPDINPSVAVVGDSYVGPTILSNTVAGAASGDASLQGMYQRMAASLGISKMTSDGIGGTGYLAGTKPFGDPSRTSWLTRVNPDVVIVHGGGCNDLFFGQTVNQTVAAAVAYFTSLATALPNAKLVFVEGFTPPEFPYQANYVLIRQGVQTQLAALGIKPYFLDVATSREPISGTGYVTAANASGNSDIYIGSDQTHPTVAGHAYLREVLTSKIAKVLADSGPLAGTLI